MLNVPQHVLWAKKQGELPNAPYLPFFYTHPYTSLTQWHFMISKVLFNLADAIMVYWLARLLPQRKVEGSNPTRQYLCQKLCFLNPHYKSLEQTFEYLNALL